MRHKLCRSFHPWCPGVKNRCLFLIIREPGYWYQQPLSDYKKCQIAVCSSWAYGTHWDPQWQPDTTGVVITPLQQIHIDNRGQPACRSLMGLGWGCPIDCLGKLASQNRPYRAAHPRMAIGGSAPPGGQEKTKHSGVHNARIMLQVLRPLLLKRINFNLSMDK